MHAKLFVELGVEVGSGLATQLNGSLAAMQASLRARKTSQSLASHCRSVTAGCLRHSMSMRDRSHDLLLSLMAHLD